MRRFAIFPVVALTLAIVSVTGLVSLQDSVKKSHAAQLTLVRAENQLNQLQGFPWQVENPRFGSPGFVRSLMAASEKRLLSTIEHLQQTTPSPGLATLAGRLSANFASLQTIFAMGLKPGGWNDPGPTNDAAQAATVSLAKAQQALDAAGAAYNRKARTAELTAVLGGVGTIAALFAAFLFYYVRSRRALRAQSRTVEALSAAQDERRRLLERTVEVAEHERIRLALDLHDGPIQHLTALALNLDRLGSRLDRGDLAAASSLFEEVRHALGGEMAALRRVMVELRPPVLDEGGLRAALNDVAAKVLGDTSTVWFVRCEIEHRLAPGLETAMYRIVNEALVNVRKHARASQVEILVQFTDAGGVQLVIADDGSGFDPSAVRRGPDGHGYGLLGIRERIAGLGGQCEVKSRPGDGTRIEATLPLRGRENREGSYALVSA